MAKSAAEAQEAKWRAEEDARVLAQAAEIQADRKRQAAAKRRARELAKEAEAKAKAMKKVASSTKKRPRRKK